MGSCAPENEVADQKCKFCERVTVRSNTLKTKVGIMCLTCWANPKVARNYTFNDLIGDEDDSCLDC